MIIFGLVLLIIWSIITILVFGVTFGTIFFGTLSLLVVIWGVLNKTSEHKYYQKKIKFIKKIFLILIIIWFLTFLIIEALIISVNSDVDIKADYLIILGAGLRGEEPSLTLKYRLEKSLEYLKENPDLQVIVSGGQGKGESITEARAMEGYLIEKGIEKSRIIKEKKSTNTYENLLYSKEILDGLSRSKNYEVMIITSDFHLFRAKLLAKEIDLKAYGIKADTPFYLLVNYQLREYFALIKSMLLYL